jgi:signal transduction histidine kinase
VDGHETYLEVIGSLPYPMGFRTRDGSDAHHNQSWRVHEVPDRVWDEPDGVLLRLTGRAVWQVRRFEAGGFLCVSLHDETPREEALLRCEAYRRGVRSMMDHQNEESEWERRRIARWLHDGPIQRLVALRWQVQTLGEQSVSRALEEILTELRDESVLLHDWRDWREIVRDMCETQQAELRWAMTDEPVDDEVRALFVRAVREALLNIERHAQATESHVTFSNEGDKVVLRVWDNGVGVTPADITRARESGHLGIVSLGFEVERLDGVFRIGAGRDGRGCLVELRLPLGR